MNRSLTASILSVVALSCAGPTLLREASPDLILQTVESHRDAVRTLQGSGRVAIETPELAQSAAFQVALVKPDSLLVNVEGPFGLELASALITRTSFIFYNSLRNQVLTGPTDVETLSRILRLRLTFDDAISLFTGGIFLGEDRTAPDSFETDGDSYVLTFRHAGTTRRYWVEPEHLLITRIEQAGTDGKPVAEQRFSDFRTVDGVRLPSRIRVTLQREQRMISIAYSSVALNRAVPAMAISVPDNAERRTIR